MPSRNIVKFYDAPAYYHIYNRGVEKRVIFMDDQDYATFANLLKRYIDDQFYQDSSGRPYEKLNEQIELIAFCLMPTHFHLLIFQTEPETMTRLLRGVATAYTRYFNKKYKRVGSLFQGIYKASQIDNDAYLMHITRYIHLNPADYSNWHWSSLPGYLGRVEMSWVHPERILDSRGLQKYQDFLEDYQDDANHFESYSVYLADQ